MLERERERARASERERERARERESSPPNLLATRAQVPLLAPLTSFERERLSEALDVVNVEAGKIVLEQGTDGSIALHFTLAISLLNFNS